MFGTVNVVTVQWSQRCCGTGRLREKVCVHATSCPPTAVIPSPLCSLVKDSSLCKFNQTAWIKAITQFVYKASFILCQASAPLTICGLLTSDWCRGHMMHLLRSSTRVFQAITRRQGAKDAWWESYYSNLSNTEPECKTTWPYQYTGWIM